MSSTTTPNITRTKSNLAVASLINGGTSGGIKSTHSSIQPQEQKPTKTEVHMVIATTIKDVPTVANADLLYKNVSSYAPGVMSPLKSSTCLTGNYALQQYSILNSGGDFRVVSTSNPLTNIRTLTNAITTSPLGNTMVPVTKVEASNQFQGKTSYIPILPANKIKAQSKDSQNIKFISTESNATVASKVASSSSKATFHGKLHSGKVNHNKKMSSGTANAIFVPRGWNRIVEKQHITYVR